MFSFLPGGGRLHPLQDGTSGEADLGTGRGGCSARSALLIILQKRCGDRSGWLTFPHTGENLMLRTWRWLVLPAVLFGWLGLVSPAAAVFPPAIKDDAKLFSAEAVEKANKKIREIYSTYKKDVVIETYAAIPADLEKKFKDKGKAEFFKEWAATRGKELGLNGLYILICKEPRYLYMEVDTRSKKAFKTSDGEKLKKTLFTAFKEKKYDTGLTEALDVVESAFKSNLKK
jgi:hypothetical protein